VDYKNFKIEGQAGIGEAVEIDRIPKGKIVLMKG